MRIFNVVDSKGKVFLFRSMGNTEQDAVLAAKIQMLKSFSSERARLIRLGVREGRLPNDAQINDMVEEVSKRIVLHEQDFMKMVKLYGMKNPLEISQMVMASKEPELTKKREKRVEASYDNFFSKQTEVPVKDGRLLA